MLQRSFFVAAILGVAGVFASTNLSFAQYRGGHSHGGHNHGGHGHGGYGHGGYGHGGYGGHGHHGHHHNSGISFGYGGISIGLGSPYYGGSYYSAPYYNSYAPLYLNTAPRYYAEPQIVYAPQPAVDNSASIRVLLPDPQARVWFDGNLTKQTGGDRYFYTGDLNPAGGPYNYRIRAAWTQGGQEMVQERVVQVAAGQTSTADFRGPVSEPVPAPRK